MVLSSPLCKSAEMTSLRAADLNTKQPEFPTDGRPRAYSGGLAQKLMPRLPLTSCTVLNKILAFLRLGFFLC